MRSILAHRGAEWRKPTTATVEGADLRHPDLSEEIERPVVAEADMLRQGGVGGEAEASAALTAHLSKGARGVDLANRLAQPGGRDLDRDPAGSDRFNRRLVEEAGIALGQRPGAAPNLDQIRVGEDVEEATVSALSKRVEVAPPDLVRVAPVLPDVPTLVVDRALSDEVDRADHVIEVVCLQQGRGAILGAGNEVALDSQPQRCAAHELAISGEVVARLLLPERMAPEVERLGEAVDVLGDAELLDPGLGGGGKVAIDVLGGEEALGRRLLIVGPQVQVIVGEHGAEPTPWATRAAGTLPPWSTCGSSSRRIGRRRYLPCSKRRLRFATWSSSRGSRDSRAAMSSSATSPARTPAWCWTTSRSWGCGG